MGGQRRGGGQDLFAIFSKKKERKIPKNERVAVKSRGKKFEKI